MAVSLASDVIPHTSAIYTRRRDPGGAFDAIPHPVLFLKTINTVPEHCRRILVYSFGSVSVQVKSTDKL